MARKGYKQTPEHIAKRTASQKGRIRTPESIAKWRKSISLRGPSGFRHGYASRSYKAGVWRSWSAMVARCTNPNDSRYDRYGGRGITICERWMNFSNFLFDMGERPEGLTLDRIDNDGNYEPGNCRWATRAEQNANRVFSTACKNGCICKRHRGRVYVA